MVSSLKHVLPFGIILLSKRFGYFLKNGEISFQSSGHPDCIASLGGVVAISSLFEYSVLLGL
jgi:hypothetical protein